MSEDATVYSALEQVSRTLNALATTLADVGTGITRHDNMFQNVEHNMGNFDAKIRTLESQVYALREDLKLVTEGHNNHVDNLSRHSCSCSCESNA
jgi:hypothetical protein